MNSSRSQVNLLPYDSCDGDSVSPYGDDQDNLISWILRHYMADQQPNAEAIGEEQLLASFAAIHTTGTTALQAIYDLSHIRSISPSYEPGSPKCQRRSRMGSLGRSVCRSCAS
jgi:hypothetical protein